MLNILRFDLTTYLKSKAFFIALSALIGIGIFTGTRFNLTVGEGVFLNSPYSTGFMIGILSLVIIFIASVTAYQLLFKEWDNRFDELLFTTSVNKQQFLAGRLFAFFTITFLCFVLIIAGFALGHLLRNGENISPSFSLVNYIYPLLIFGFINSLLICSVLACIAWLSKNKLLMATGGLLIYIVYMVSLIFSNSPFMTNTTPQSMLAQNISALLDPFGLSGYFTVSSHFTPAQRNSQLVPLSGLFLQNRIMMVFISGILLFFTYRKFSFTSTYKKQSRSKKREAESKDYSQQEVKPFFTILTQQNKSTAIQSVISFIKTDLIYLFKNIPLVVTTLFILFYVVMEMYAEVEKGIRLPQKYASSSLMAQTIAENLHLLGIIAAVYFINDIYWRSKESRFYFIEHTTYHSFTKDAGHSISAIVLQLFFLTAAIGLGVAFQIGYGYRKFDIAAYSGILLFTTLPIILFSIFTVLLNRGLPNKYLALAVSLASALFLATSLSKNLIPHPLFRFFTGYNGAYSDFNGYGTYLNLFAIRQFFGLSTILFAFAIFHLLFKRKKIVRYAVTATILGAAAILTGLSFSEGYMSKSKDAIIEAAVQYENKYKHYLSIPQPVITDVNTKINLYPSDNSYTIEGHYIIKNKNDKPVETILLEFEEDFSIQQANYTSNTETIAITHQLSVLKLSKPLLPGDSAAIDFNISYQWKTVNGHQSFNAIIKNGSFSRISRYYPRIGYQKENELADETEREKHGLGKQTPLRKLEDSTRAVADFINLDMIISTDDGQTAVGTGTLLKQWKEGKRNYFQYSPKQPVPFRFALSSAAYEIKQSVHNGVTISVMYHPSHDENVQHLIQNAKLTLDYCNQNFGAYPFSSVTFAEVSSFTSGFAATAYPGTIFMTEQMIFHANIKADKQQDVINELAGHELSHLWWGGNQIVPDEREGATMLTETLAMYTEMMLYKKMYGNEKMKERVKIHQQIYEAEKGFSEDEPLYKVKDGSTHICYSKGAVIMVQLSELIGEENVNKALKNFLVKAKQNKYKPLTSDFLQEVYAIAGKDLHAHVSELFEK